MSSLKRELTNLNKGDLIDEGPKSKRRRDDANASDEQGKSDVDEDKDVDMTKDEETIDGVTAESISDPVQVKEQGMKLWITIKDAQTKE